MPRCQQRLLLAVAVVTLCGPSLAAGGQDVNGEALRLGARIPPLRGDGLAPIKLQGSAVRCSPSE